jgi:predicted PurR-regulated permease PerM
MANDSKPQTTQPPHHNGLKDASAAFDASATAKLLALIAITIFFGGLYLAKEILLPLALAMLFSFLLAPLTVYFERLRLRRIPSVILVVSLTVLAIFCVGWVVTSQFIELSRKLPDYKGNLMNRVRMLNSATTGHFQKATETVEEIGEELTKEKTPETTVRVEAAGPERPNEPGTVRRRRRGLGVSAGRGRHD